jgi:hypothetical protein
MVNKHHKFIEVLNNMLDKEVDELNEIINLLSDSKTMVDSDDLPKDTMVMTAKKNSFTAVKGMVKKASLQIEGVDNEILMNAQEKKVFYQLVRTTMFFRKIFRRK